VRGVWWILHYLSFFVALKSGHHLPPPFKVLTLPFPLLFPSFQESCVTPRKKLELTRTILCYSHSVSNSSLPSPYRILFTSCNAKLQTPVCLWVCLVLISNTFFNLLIKRKKQVVEQYMQDLLVENKSGRFDPKSLGIRGIHSSDRTESCCKLQVIRLSVSQWASPC
jgi:hypothetical protein